MMNASYSLAIIALVALVLTVNSIWANNHNRVHTSNTTLTGQALK